MRLLQKLRNVAVAGLIASAIIPSGCSLENASKTQNRTYEKNPVQSQGYQKPITNHTREDFFPTLAEFSNRNFDIEGYKASGDIYKILNLTPYLRSIAYHEKIDLIHNYPEQALEKLTDGEEDNLKSFFNRSSNIDDPGNLSSISEINWREILESDYSSYKVIPSFDSIGDYDALVIFLHETFYEQKINFSKPKEDSKDEITLLRAPLYIEISGTRKNGDRSNFIAYLFNVGYYLKPSQLETFLSGLPNDITDEQALNQIREFVTENGILLDIEENFRKINISRELREKLLSPDFALKKLASSNARKYLESDEFQENKERLVALREEYTFGETLSILSSIPSLLRDTVKLSQAVGETSRDIGKDLEKIIGDEISTFSKELTEEIDKSLPGYRIRKLKRKREK